MKLQRLFVVLILLGMACLFMVFIVGTNGQEKKPRDEFAQDREGPMGNADAKPVPFDGKRAMEYLKAVCDIGPRQSGSPGMKKQQELIRKHFDQLGYRAQDQPFKATQTSQGKAVEMNNLIVSFFPEKKNRVILCSHYDTRPIADQEADPRKWREPFVSANDGGSGVAFLMEMGNHMKDLKTEVGVDFVFFDGEEYIFDKSDRYFFGSQHFAKTWKLTRGGPNYKAALLLDMIGGKNASFPYEGHSYYRYEDLCKQVWGIAQEQKVDLFKRVVDQHVLDDHISLQNVGIPAIDIIDFNYPHWHRLTDTPANCEPEPLEKVSRVLSVWMQRVR
jgi:glutaminyl-peptide cyclotransferase